MEAENIFKDSSIFGHSGDLYQSLFEQSEDAMLLIKDNKFVYCNVATIKKLKLENKDQIYTAHPAEISPTRQPCGQLSVDKAEAMLKTAYQKGSHRFTWVHRNKTGEEFPVEVCLTKLHHLNKDYIHVFWRDIAQDKQLDKTLEISGLIYNETSDAIMVTNSKNIIVDVNPAFEKITGYSKQQAIGQKAGFMKSGQHDNEFYQALWTTLNKTGKWHGQIWDRHNKGHLIPKDLKINAIYCDNNVIQGYIAIFSDCTEKINYEKELQRLAYYDCLTSFPNRTTLLEILRAKITELSTTDTSKGFYVAFVDLDNFKAINDTRGHQFGDKVLKTTISTISLLLNKNDVIGRMSGDEFLIIFNAEHTETSVNNLLNTLYQRMSLPIMINDEAYYIKLSIGLSNYPKTAQNTKSLISNADIAMYRAKSKGGNQYIYYNETLGDRFHQYHKIESELAVAISNDAIFSHYQPQVDLKTGKIVGCEALARWINNDHKNIPPNIFIAMAEKSNQIKTLSSNLLKHNCRFFNSLPEEIKASVNISVQELCGTTFVNDFITALHSLNLSTSNIVIEITESNLIKNFTFVQNTLKNLRKQGIKIAIDDFGTGFSSLSYLTKLSIDIIKLDKSFLDNIENNQGKTVLASIIKLAHKLKLIVIAEGVETIQQYNLLCEYNCDIAQGYFIAPPLNENDFRVFIKHFNESSIGVKLST
ncbi:putative bifunctional diguanylate cyclase/phosphodiesterase [Thalassotalea sediminis]|uniref:putative bifunctional diguanylate cyclase/phosphodiesterase n=1 Tax=Thalassotalea sediminis TaxID=1759089 RepID=UPI002572775E|nr:bifunctional diguanylate cyclase/phosphodiesterase [Thalassotalea sediminis]